MPVQRVLVGRGYYNPVFKKYWRIATAAPMHLDVLRQVSDLMVEMEMIWLHKHKRYSLVLAEVKIGTDRVEFLTSDGTLLNVRILREAVMPYVDEESAAILKPHLRTMEELGLGHYAFETQVQEWRRRFHIEARGY